MKNIILNLFFLVAIVSCKKDQIKALPKLECEEITNLDEAKLVILGTWKLESDWMKDNPDIELISKAYNFVDSANLIITTEFEIGNFNESTWNYYIENDTNETELLEIFIEGQTPGLGGTLKICNSKMGIESKNHWEIFTKN